MLKFHDTNTCPNLFYTNIHSHGRLGKNASRSRLTLSPLVAGPPLSQKTRRRCSEVVAKSAPPGPFFAPYVKIGNKERLGCFTLCSIQNYCMYGAVMPPSLFVKGKQSKRGRGKGKEERGREGLNKKR